MKLLADAEICVRATVLVVAAACRERAVLVLRTATEACGWSCARLISDFPIDWFLAHPGSNYVANRSQGPAAHQARIALDRLMGNSDPETVNSFYEQMAALGLGRQITAYLRLKPTP